MSLITSLNIFSNETIADTPPINQNFETIRVAINDNFDRVVGATTNFANSITSLDQAITKTRTDLTEEFGAVAETKLNVNLSNLGTNIQKIFDSFTPNLEIREEITSKSKETWLEITKASWLYIFHHNSSDGQTITVEAKNGEDGTNQVIFRSQDTGTWSTGLRASGFLFVNKGQFIKWTGSGNNTLYLYECMGAV